MCQRQKANITLTAKIREAFVASDETYGMPRICAELLDAGIVAIRRRNFCVTTVCDIRHRPAPDFVTREFVATDINQLWVADMTYIPTWMGFVYLAMVIDLYSRKVGGPLESA